jgi:hypothetical protein
MKKSTKVWLGIATGWPILYMLIFFVAIILLMIFASSAGGPSAPDPVGTVSLLMPIGLVAFMAAHMITIFGSLALTVFYIVRIFKTEQLDQNMKIMWTLLMFFAGMLVQPVFWYFYIWRETPIAAEKQPLLVPGLQPAWARQTATSQPEVAYVPPIEPPDWR